MLYRRVGRTGDGVGVIGLGLSSNETAGSRETIRMVSVALDARVNYIDTAIADVFSFEAVGKALSGRREQAMLQTHFRADYTSGVYGRVYSLDEVKISIEWQMKKVWTDYIGHVFIHCIDGLDAPFDEWGDGAVDYILKLKDDGTVHHVGLSTHILEMAMRTLDSGIVDMMMFSINSAYDYRRGEFAFGDVDERTFLYGRCQVEGVEISVMKAFSGGS